MQATRETQCTLFAGSRLAASGKLAEVAVKAKELLDKKADVSLLIFDDESSEQIEVDFRGNAQDVVQRLATVSQEPAVDTPRGPGRPKLGVVAREVTLLPRHWDWLNSQPGGASVALRKLVEEARRANAGKDRVRRAQESAYRFLSAMAGDLPGFEEAARALFAGKRSHFERETARWPAGIRDHARKLADAALQESS
jgi:hypothetical protein